MHSSSAVGGSVTIEIIAVSMVKCGIAWCTVGHGGEGQAERNILQRDSISLYFYSLQLLAHNISAVTGTLLRKRNFSFYPNITFFGLVSENLNKERGTTKKN